MTLKICGVPASRAFRCLWAAEECGRPYESVPWSHLGSDIKQPAYLAINPNGTIPALSHDGFNLFESLVINLYLARTSGKLLPTNARDEALVLDPYPQVRAWHGRCLARPAAQVAIAMREPKTPA